MKIIELRLPGTINGYVLMYVTWQNKKIAYNGTTTDMVTQLVRAGANVNDQFTDEVGRVRRITSTSKGCWVTQWNLSY